MSVFSENCHVKGNAKVLVQSLLLKRLDWITFNDSLINSHQKTSKFLARRIWKNRRQIKKIRERRMTNENRPQLRRILPNRVLGTSRNQRWKGVVLPIVSQWKLRSRNKFKTNVKLLFYSQEHNEQDLRAYQRLFRCLNWQEILEGL